MIGGMTSPPLSLQLLLTKKEGKARQLRLFFLSSFPLPPSLPRPPISHTTLHDIVLVTDALSHGGGRSRHGGGIDPNILFFSFLLVLSLSLTLYLLFSLQCFFFILISLQFALYGKCTQGIIIYDYEYRYIFSFPLIFLKNFHLSLLICHSPLVN